MMKPIILQILPNLNSGGVERVTIDTAGFLAQVDGAPTYVASAGGLLVPELESRGVKHIQLPLGAKAPWQIIANGFRLARLAKRLGVDLFHVRSRAPAWSTLIASKLTGIPYISTYHGAYRRNLPLKNWYNSAMARGKCVITISDFVSRLVQKDHGRLNPKIIKIIPGIDANGKMDPKTIKPNQIAEQRKAWGIPEEARILLTIGRIAPNKRFDLSIRALAQLGRKDVYLVLAGSDQGREALSQELLDLAKELGVSDRVILVRDFPNIPLVYAMADVVLFPTSHIETYGRISAEGAAMAKIVIACDIGAVTELIEDGVTGFVIPEKDLDALVDRTQHVLAMPEVEKKAMETRARQRVDELYTAERMYAETLNVYRGIAK